MASKKPRRLWTAREDDIATFLFRTPATTDQLLYVSQTWEQQFASLDRTQRRLNDLCQAGWLFRSRYAIASQVGTQHYYQLTLAGYRLWQRDARASPPTKRFFAPAADAMHHHQYAKAKFLTHLTVAAHARGFRIENDKPENTVMITVNGTSLRPDHYLELVSPSGRHFRRFFEFDRSTETQVTDDNTSHSSLCPILNNADCGKQHDGDGDGDACGADHAVGTTLCLRYGR